MENPKGGLLDMLVNKGTLPEVSVSISKESLIALGLMIIISAVIILLINAILKHLLK